MMLRQAVLIALLCCAGAASALNVNDPRRFECRQGSCINGPGVAWDAALSVNMQGNWSNGQTIPGEAYIITLPIAPKKQFKQVYGQDGFLESGDQPRSLGVFNGVVPFFRGSFGRITHAFMRQTVAVIREGVYNNDLGIEYRGRFEYLPAKSGMNNGWGSGFYIFYGDKVDTEDNEKETGLYVSDENMGGAPVRFVKADPSYLAVMQKKYQQDMALAQGDFQAQESAKKWQSALAVLGKVAFSLASANTDFGGGGNPLGGNLMGLGGGGMGNLGSLAGLGGRSGGGGGNLAGDLAMSLVSGMFNKGGSINVKDLATQAVGSVAGGNRQLSNLLMKAVSEGLEEADNPGGSLQARSTGGLSSTGRPASAGAGVMDALAGAVINNTTNTIASAITGSTNNAGLGNLTGSLINQVITSKSPSSSNTPGGGTLSQVQQPASSGAGLAGVFAGAVVNNTTNTMASAVSSSTGNPVLGNLSGTVINQALSSKTLPSAATEGAIANKKVPLNNDPPGTVQLQYTPGKGFLDPVTGKYIKTMEEMSCDNVTTNGVKIRDLPPDQRACVETGTKVSVGLSVLPASTPAAPTPAPTSTHAPPAPAAMQEKTQPAKAVSAKSRKSGGSDAIDPALIAQLEKIDPPEGLSYRMGRMYATNDGVYLAASKPDRTPVVAKRTVGRGSERRWQTWPLPKGDAKFSVTSLRDEGPDHFGISWVSDGRFGYSNMNNNGLSINEENNGAYAFIPIGAKSTYARQWAIGKNDQVFLNKTGGDGRRDFRGRFDPIPDEPEDSVKNETNSGLQISKDLAASDEEGSTLYVRGDDLSSIVQITILKKITRISLSGFGTGIVNTLVAAHGRLWIGYGDQILTLRDGKLSLFAKMSGVLATIHPTFCMAGTTLYTADGQVRHGVDISPSTPRSFLQTTANVRQEDFMALTEMRTSLNTGMYCAGSAGWGPVVYTMGANLGTVEPKLFIITPK